MIKVTDLLKWLKDRKTEEVYIDGDELCCYSDDSIWVGDNEADEDDEEDDE